MQFILDYFDCFTNQNSPFNLCNADCKICEEKNQDFNTMDTGCSGCLKSYADRNGICVQCPNKCPRCNFQNSNANMRDKECTCNSQYFETDAAKCEQNLDQCNQSGCKFCKSGNCYMCEIDFKLNANKKCQQCSSSQYTDLLDSKCKNCEIQNCKQCSTSEKKCDECQDGYELINEQCKIKCQDGQFINNSKCDDCNLYNCKTCNIDQLSLRVICKTCIDNFKLDEKKQCTKTIQPINIRQIIKILSISQSRNTISINFENNQIEMNKLIDQLKISISNLSKDDFMITKKQVNNKSIQIIIQPERPMKELKTVTIDIQTLSDSQIYINQQEEINVQLYKEKYLDENQNDIANQVAYTKDIIATTTLQAALPMALVGSFSFISGQVDICQLIYLTNFINTNTPRNLDQFLESQKSFQVSFTNFFKSMSNYDKIYYPTSNKLYANDLQGFLLSNVGDSLSLTLTTISCIVAFYLLQKAFQKFKKISDILLFLQSKINCGQFWLDTLWSIYPDICFSTIIQIISIHSPELFEEYINYFVFAISIFFSAFPLILCYFIIKKKTPVLLDNLGQKLNCKYYRMLLYFRKFLYTLISGAFQFNANVQISILIIFHSCFFIFIVKKSPFEEKFYNIKETIQTLLFVSSTIMFSIIHNTKIDSEDQRIVYGWVIISQLMVIIFCDIVVMVRDLILAIFKFIKERKSKNEKLVKVVPIKSASIDQDGIKKQLNSSIELSKEQALSDINIKQFQVDGSPSPALIQTKTKISFGKNRKNRSTEQQIITINSLRSIDKLNPQSEQNLIYQKSQHLLNEQESNELKSAQKLQTVIEKQEINKQ